MILASDLKNTLLSELGSGGVNAVAHTAYGHPRAEQPVSAHLGYNGEFAEPQTGWQLLGKGYRAYNPRLMRFHRPDSSSPFEDGGMNAYAYCGGDPINRSDPSGHSFTWGSVMRYFGVATKSNVLAKIDAFYATEGGKPYRWDSKINSKKLVDADIDVDSGPSVAQINARREIEIHNKNFDLEQRNFRDYQDLLSVEKGKLYAKPYQIKTRVGNINRRREEQEGNFKNLLLMNEKPPSYEVASPGLPTYAMAIRAGSVRGSTSS